MELFHFGKKVVRITENEGFFSIKCEKIPKYVFSSGHEYDMPKLKACLCMQSKRCQRDKKKHHGCRI